MLVAMDSETQTSGRSVWRIEEGTSGVTGPCRTSRLVNRYHEANDPSIGDRVHVDPVPGRDHLGGADRRGFRWDGAQVAAHSEAAVQRILRNREGTQRADARSHLSPFLDRTRKLRRVGLNESEMTCPTGATIANIRAAQIRDHLAVDADVLAVGPWMCFSGGQSARGAP